MEYWEKLVKNLKFEQTKNDHIGWDKGPQYKWVDFQGLERGRIALLKEFRDVLNNDREMANLTIELFENPDPPMIKRVRAR